MKLYRSIGAISVMLFLAGCSSVSTPTLPEFKASQLDKNLMTNLKESEVKYLFNVTFNNYIQENGGSQYLKTAQSSPFLAVSGTNSSIVDARDTYNYSYTYGYYFDQPNNNIIEVQQSSCLSKGYYPTTGKIRIIENDCKEFAALYKAPKAFETQVESARSFVKNTFPVLLNNYNINKPQVDKCRQMRSQERIEIQDKTGLLDKNFLKTLQPVITTETMMPPLKIAQIPAQNFSCNALSDRVIIDLPITNKKYSFQYDHPLPMKVEYTALPKNISITDVRYNFLNGYETDDKVLKVAFILKTGMMSYWEVSFTNMSDEFIEIQDSDFKNDEKKMFYISSSKFPISVPPKSSINVNLEGYVQPQSIKTFNDAYPINIAVKYKKGAKEITMLKNEKIKIESLK